MNAVKPVAASMTAFALVACGGSGERRVAAVTETLDPPPAVSSSTVHLSASAHTAAARVASSLPAFGSVTQSANRDGATGVSTDRASTTFDGESFILRVERQSGNDIRLDTSDDDVEAYAYDRLPVPGHDAGAGGYIVDYTPGETTVALVGVSWLESDPGDYLSGGYWLHANGDVLGDGFVVDEAGVFVDGPDLDLADRPTMPVRGRATYTGYAEGLYARTFGSEFPEGRRGQTDLGTLAGGVELRADFGAGTIGGCVGCNEPLHLDEHASHYRLLLGDAPFDGRGVFRGSEVTLESPTADLAVVSGRWGGMFSNRLDAAGEPRLVAGTFGGEAATPGGTTGVFIGAFYGAK